MLDEKPNNIAIVGDRIHIDLIPAKSLGMTTILVGTGKSKSPYVDLELRNICDLDKLL